MRRAPAPAAYRAAVVASALLFSTGGTAIKSCGLTPWQVASFRSAIAAAAVFVILPAARQRWTWRMLLVSAAHAATMILFVRANRLTTAASTIFLQSAAPLYVMLLSPVLLGEPVRRGDVGFMLVLAGGMALFFVGVETPAATAPNPLAGNVLAALSSVTWALTVMGLRWRGTRERGGAGSAAAAVVAGNLIAFLVSLPAALPLAGVAMTDWVILAFLGVFQVGLAYVFLAAAIPHVPALEASLLLLLEPVASTVWAWLVHGEQPGWPSMLGGAVILAATAIRAARA